MSEIIKFSDTKAVNEFLELRGSEIEKLLPPEINRAKFIRVVLNAVNANPKLLQCSQVRFFNSVMICAEIGLMPNTVNGHCYIIPYWNKAKNTSEAQFQYGYKGLIELARRSGEIASIECDGVYEGDEFDFTRGTASFLKHKPKYKADRTKENLTHVWVLVRYKNGTPESFDVMPKAEIEKHRMGSQGADGNFWNKWYEEMGIKTCLIKMFNFMPMSSDFRSSLALAPEYESVEFKNEPILIPDTTERPSLNVTELN